MSNGAIAVFNGVFTTIAPMLKINQEKGNEFIVVAYSSTPMLTKMGNKLMASPNTPPCQLLYGNRFLCAT